MASILPMPELPPEANEWKKAYCARWLKLITAQEQLLNTQLRVIETQRELIRELLEREE